MTASGNWHGIQTSNCLKLRVRISGLRRQVKYELIPAQKDLKTGKVIERPVTYKADFVYTDVSTGREIVEDAKGVRTKEYVIKRKLMLYNKGIQVREV